MKDAKRQVGFKRLIWLLHIVCSIYGGLMSTATVNAATYVDDIAVLIDTALRMSESFPGMRSA